MARVIDLFAGAGLLSAGFRAAGFKIAHAIELDRNAVANYRRNVGDHASIASVLEIDPSARAEVIVAGPPCQGFSTLGRRDPSDERNSLCLIVPKWAESARAKIAVVENVPTFLGSAHWKRMARRFEKMGFSISTWELDANDFGVPQRRVRSFTVASRIGDPSPPRKRKVGLTVRDAFSGINTRTSRTDALHRWNPLTSLAAERIALIPKNGDKRDILLSRPDLCPPSWRSVGCAATDVWGRMIADEPANTIRCTFLNPSKGRYLHPSENRTISLREGARLQGIPDSWQMEGDPYVIARQIGNGVPIPLARAVASQVIKLL